VVWPPLSPGARLTGLEFATRGDGSEDPSVVVALASDGATYAYEAT
jgi:hypothetical protein